MSERITAGFIDSFPLSETHSFLCFRPLRFLSPSYLRTPSAHPSRLPSTRAAQSHLESALRCEKEKRRGGRKRGTHSSVTFLGMPLGSE